VEKLDREVVHRERSRAVILNFSGYEAVEEPRQFNALI
jgi:hypothetical protein